MKSLGTVPAETLDLADAVVLSSAAPERERLRQVMRFSPRPFTCRGKEVTVLFHPWTSIGRWNRQATPVSAKKKGWRIADLPLGVPAGETTSLTVWLPRPVGKTAELLVGGRTLPLVRVGRKGRMQLCLSPRFVSPGEGQEIRLRLQEHWGLPSEIDLTIYRWAPPGPAAVVE